MIGLRGVSCPGVVAHCLVFTLLLTSGMAVEILESICPRESIDIEEVVKPLALKITNLIT